MAYPITQRNKLKRIADRGHYDRASVYEVLDAGLIAHIGIVSDGQPIVIPMMYGRKEDALYFHGAKASRLMKYLRDGGEASVTVTLLDGLVLARSLFEHSMNYRSVVAFGKGRAVDDPGEKLAALKVIAEHMLPGRWEDARQPTEKELNATIVAAVQIEEATAKIRTGGAEDYEEDLSYPVWAGVVPIKQIYEEPEAEGDLMEGVEIPAYIRRLTEAGDSP